MSIRILVSLVVVLMLGIAGILTLLVILEGRRTRHLVGPAATTAENRRFTKQATAFAIAAAAFVLEITLGIPR